MKRNEREIEAFEVIEDLFARKRKEVVPQAEYRSALGRLQGLKFITEALLGVAQDIADCFDEENLKWDLKCIEREVKGLKDEVKGFAKEAPEDIRRKYLPLVIDSLNVFLENAKTDIRNGRPWKEINEKYGDCLDKMFVYLCLAFREM